MHRGYDSIQQVRISNYELIYNTLMDGLCKLGYLEGARKLKNDMVNHGILPDVLTYTIRVNGKWDPSWCVYL
ncbi:Pentatricopeptide repeat-containing protein At1g22960, mitochondrial [Linum grandiflorum]